MNNDYTDISLVLDASGSMKKLRQQTIDGCNTFIAEQQKVPGKCLLSLLQFNTEFRLIHDSVDIHAIKPITLEDYTPDDWTALLDAIGNTITRKGKQLAAMAEADRPGKVVVAIMTDGEENQSKEYKGDEGRKIINDMIKHQTEAYKWNFLFLGANQNAIKTAEDLGIQANNALTYAANDAGTEGVFAAAAGNIAAYRVTGNVQALGFKREQRVAQRTAGAQADALNH